MRSLACDALCILAIFAAIFLQLLQLSCHNKRGFMLATGYWHSLLVLSSDRYDGSI